MRITAKSKNLSKWYTETILIGELADYAPVKGSMVIRPYGYALWEAIQKHLDAQIQEHGIRNAYFPLFIPESLINREKEHVTGFAPQLAVVTYAGGEELKEKLVVRPTSETIMYEMYKQWTQSYRDLPILINLWNNVVRWEKRTYLFLRTSEFLWQEGHCAHETHQESLDVVRWALKAYQNTYQNLLALYGIAGMKSASEKFAGADSTYSYEILMPDGRALQGCTSHDLGQNFSKAFGWEIAGRDGKKLHPWQNSWGLSTRSIGGLIMVHGDDHGLILPPKVAPIQVIIIPIPGSQEGTFTYADKIKEDLLALGVRCEIDSREDETAGSKFNKWELKGVPVRIEVGDRESKNSDITAVLRHKADRVKIALDQIPSLLDDMQSELFSHHQKFTEDNSRTVDSYAEFQKIMAGPRGFIYAFWCESRDCEEKIKAETKATVRCLPEDAKKEAGSCILCGREANYRWLFAQSY